MAEEARMNHKAATRAYYAAWLGLLPEQMSMSGVQLVYNPGRDAVPAGYGSAKDVFAYATGNQIILSYGNRAAELVDALRGCLWAGMPVDMLADMMTSMLGAPVSRQLKFQYTTDMPPKEGAVALTPAHWPLYEDFFRAVHPSCGDTSWLEEYFLRMCDQQYAYGVLQDGLLVSATDAPDMPYLSGTVQEIGINTRAEYRKRGFAQVACLAAVHGLMARGICPLWSTAAENTASEKLAYAVGFTRLADVLTMGLA